MKNKKKKVAMVCICLNPPYWEYAADMINTADQFFLNNHDVEYIFWTDMPEKVDDMDEGLYQAMRLRHHRDFSKREMAIEQAPDKFKKLVDKKNELLDGLYDTQSKMDAEQIKFVMQSVLDNKKVKIIPTEPVEWPYPTLMRYHLFLNEEELLKKYDYVFYCDIDMRFVGEVGDEILGDGLTGAQHPMYALRPGLQFPLEPNPKSEAYINVPKYYYAGGFQGGKTNDFIKAMKEMKKMIDKDFNNNYIARWNDESHWNKYLFDNPPVITLSPSYVYPDSLINEYYKPIWGQDYVPKLVTLTKKFTTSAEGGAQAQKFINDYKNLK